MTQFNDIEKELNTILTRCSVVKYNLRKYCSFSVEMQYMLIVNFIGMGYYNKVPDLLDNLTYHPDTSQLDTIEILKTTKELMICASKLDSMHNYDAKNEIKNASMISHEANIFALRIGKWLEHKTAL